MQAYRIVNWNKRYESAESRKLVSLPRVMIPDFRGSKEYNRLVRHPRVQANDPSLLEVLGCLQALCLLTGELEHEDRMRRESRPGPGRGWVIDDRGVPYTPEDVADALNLPGGPAVIIQCLQILMEVNLVELAELPADGDVMPAPAAQGTLFDPALAGPANRTAAVNNLCDSPPAQLPSLPKGPIPGGSPGIPRQSPGFPGGSPGSPWEPGAKGREGNTGIPTARRTDPVNSSRLHRADTGTGAIEPRADDRTGSDRPASASIGFDRLESAPRGQGPPGLELRRHGREREAELCNRFAQVSGLRFELAFTDAFRVLAGGPLDRDNANAVGAVGRKIRDHPRRAELAGQAVFKMLIVLEWIRRGHEGNAWRIWQGFVNRLLATAGAEVKT